MINTIQIRRIHALLGKLRIREQKPDLVANVSGGRTQSVKELTGMEAGELIRHLVSFTGEQQHQPQAPPPPSYAEGQSKRRRIMSICHQLPPEKGFTRWDDALGKRVVDLARLDEFLKGPKSIFKKRLNAHTPAELSKVIVQFESMLKGYLKGN